LLKRGLWFAPMLLTVADLPGQVTAPAPASSSSKGEIVQLSEFTVSEDKDIGYSTTNAIGVTRTNTAIIDTPQAVNVINQEFLRDAVASELYDVLKYVSGVSIESNVGDSVMIRGYTVRGQYTDGLSDNQNQSQAGSEPFLFERLEVLKGPSALVYGSHATGGVLNRVRKTPQWKRRGELGLTLGNHGQRKAELDYTAPINDQFAYRLIGVYREEDLNNGVNTRFSWFKRWNVDPMITWRPLPKVQIKVVGEFLHEEHFKHWGDNAQLAPFAVNGPTTFGRLPRDYTFTDPWATNDNDKQAVWAAAEAQVTPEWSLRLAGYVNYWDHDVYDILPAGMQANNVLMNRTGRFIYNYDSDKTIALDSVYNFKVGPSAHKFLFIAQHAESDNDTGTLTANAPPPLDVFNPVYNYTTLVNPRLTANVNSQGVSDSLSFNDHVQLIDDRFQIVAGARFDKYRSHSDNLLTGVRGTRNRGDTWTYKAGAVWKPIKSFSVFYNYAETFTPNFGSNPDASTFVPSYGVVNEVGVKSALREGRITATLSAFDLQLKNIITGHPDPTLASAGWRVQQLRQKTLGVEGDLIFNLIPGWDLMVAGSLLKIELAGGLLPRNAPEKTGSAWTRYKFQGGSLKGVVVGGGWTYKGRSPAEAGNVVMFPGFSTFDAFAQYQWGRYRFSLNVSNATDKWYLARGINRNIFFTGPERLIKLRVAYQF
jgi:iron complex outermembrane receptor protein